jgi:hypothetical protein
VEVRSFDGMFFKGEFIPWEEYKKREDNGTESGYAWIIKDPKLKNTIGKKYLLKVLRTLVYLRIPYPYQL